MRIAQVTATFPPYLAGTGYVAYYQSRELARLGHEVHVLTAASKSDGDNDHPEGVYMHHLSALTRIGNAPLLPGLLNLQAFDIVHLHYPFISGAELTWAACRRREMPYLVNYHNDLIGVGLRKLIFNTYKRLFSELVLGHAATILAVTLDHAQNCQATSIFQKYDLPVEELNNGVDVEHFTPHWDGNFIRNKLGIAAKSKVILFVGALDKAHHFKGVSVLLKAFKQIARGDTYLVLVGSGDMKEAYISESVDLGIDALTYFSGRVPHDDLPAYYAASDIVVLPSSQPESFGMVIIEGMACGKPVIGSHIPGIRALIDEGRDGLLVHPGDAEELASKLAEMLDLTPDERQLMGVAGRRKVEEKFSWRSIGHRLVRIYSQVLGIEI